MTVDGFGDGNFSSNLSNLSNNTTYYLRAYATNSLGTAYGNQVTFTTLSGNSIPTVTTQPVSNVGANSAVSGGDIISDGGLNVSSKGVCWSTNPNPTNNNINFMTIDGTGNGSFSSNLSNLNHSTTYYLRAYASNSLGTAYGNQVTFTTSFQNSPCSILSSTTHTNGWYILQNPTNTIYSPGDTYALIIESPYNYSFSPTNYTYLYLNEQMVLSLGYNQFSSQTVGGILTYYYNFTIPSGLTASNCYTMRISRNGDTWVSNSFTILN